MKWKLLQALRYAVVAGAVVAAVHTLIVARAASLFQQETALSVAAAVRLQPHNATYLDRLAGWQLDERQSLLKRSVAENPFNDDAWIRLGLLAEMQDGDIVTAEKYYRKAAQVNHMFLPRWTLANFYFRQQKPDAFFHWSKETLAITPYASDPVFAQMHLMTQDEATLNDAIPDRPRILLQYIWYLSNNKRFSGIPRAAERLVKAVGKDDPNNWGRNDLLASSEDHMLAAGILQPALKVWSTLQDAGWIEPSVPNGQHPVTNGEFKQRFYKHGFDWVPVENPGTRVEHFPDTGLRISLYGDQAEKTTLLQQYVPVAPDRRYLMSWQVQAEDLSEPSGLAWHLHPVQANGTAEIASGDLLSPVPDWEFNAPPQAQVFLLTLEYVRPLGNTRARGTVLLKSVKMNQK